MADKYLNNKDEKNTKDNVTPAASAASYEQVISEHKFYFHVVKKRYIWFIVSLLMLAVCLISLSVQGLNVGIDFTGGTMFNIKFEQPVTQAAISQALDSTGLTGQVQLSPQNDTDAIIRTQPLEPDQRDAFLDAVQAEAGSFDYDSLGEDLVGPAIGAELRSNALKALAVASILILAYVSLRFRFVYAVSAILALTHDIIITLGLFSIFQLQIEAAFIAAILTVFGYSINNTVVIYDRIRENEKRLKKKESFEDMVDKSVWQNMSRSVRTTVTVLIALLAIFILGGASTKMFALAMIIGLVSGLYTSVLIASQLVVEFTRRFGGRIRRKNA